MLFGGIQIPVTAVMAGQQSGSFQALPSRVALASVSGGGSPLGLNPPSLMHRHVQTQNPVDDVEAWVTGSALSAGFHL